MMHDSGLNNHLFGLFKSKKRIKLLDLLINNKGSLHFNEIAKQLNVIPSTLEYHLKQLVDQGLIEHHENQYSINAYSRLIWSALYNLSNLTPLLPFLQTHVFPVNNPRLLSEFGNLKLKLAPDLISLLSFMQNKNLKQISKLQLAGTFDLELEEKSMRLSAMELIIDKIEIISTRDSITKFINYKNFEFFLSFTKLENFNLFLIEECNFYLGIFNDFGVLFLPKVNNIVDFQQCLIFEGDQNIQWLNKLYTWLKSDSKKIIVTEEFLKDKSSFEKYLDGVKILK